VLGTEPDTNSDWSQYDATIAALAKVTRSAPEVVKQIYDEEIAALHSNAKVKNFVGIVAGRRVKRRLMALKANDH